MSSEVDELLAALHQMTIFSEAAPDVSDGLLRAVETGETLKDEDGRGHASRGDALAGATGGAAGTALDGIRWDDLNGPPSQTRRESTSPTRPTVGRTSMWAMNQPARPTAKVHGVYAVTT